MIKGSAPRAAQLSRSVPTWLDPLKAEPRFADECQRVLAVNKQRRARRKVRFHARTTNVPRPTGRTMLTRNRHSRR